MEITFKVKSFLILAFFALFAFAYNVKAKELYVSPQGDDSVTCAGNDSDHPWQTIGRAAWGSTNRSSPDALEAARAGDTVNVRPGTYATTGTNIRYAPAYNPVNSGTQGNPIVFQADGLVTLTYLSGVGPVIGANGKNYITWKGFYINEAEARSTPDTGPAVLWATVGSTLGENVLNGNGDDYGRVDNHPGIRIEYCGPNANLLIKNNRIYNFYSQSNATNGTGIQVYDSGGITIENNEIYSSGSGMSLKHMEIFTGAFVVRFNLIRNVEVGIRAALLPNTADQPVKIYQNIIKDSSTGISLVSSSASNVKIANNTFYNNPYGFWPRVVSAANTFWNNIVFSGGGSTMYSIFSEDNLIGSGITKAQLDIDHNLYYGFTRFAQVFWVNYSTFSSWQATFNQDLISAVLDPLFVNPAGGDFKLQSNSPARNFGVDILDLDHDGSTTDPISAGAYVTGNEIIGLSLSHPEISLPKTGDLNSDNAVDILDYNLLVSHFNQTGLSITGDINSSGRVDIFDFNLLVGNFGN